MHEHERKKLMINLFTIPMFIGILVLLSFFSKPVSRIVNYPRQLVAGVHDTKAEDTKKENFTKALASDTSEQVGEIKDQVMNTSVEDMVHFFGRGGKIMDDLNYLKDQTFKLVEGIKLK